MRRFLDFFCQRGRFSLFWPPRLARIEDLRVHATVMAMEDWRNSRRSPPEIQSRIKNGNRNDRPQSTYNPICTYTPICPTDRAVWSAWTFGLWKVQIEITSDNDPPNPKYGFEYFIFSKYFCTETSLLFPIEVYLVE